MAYWTYQAFQIIKPYLSATETYVAAYSLGAFLKFGNAVNNKTSMNTTSIIKDATVLGKNGTSLNFTAMNVTAINVTSTILSF